MKIKFSSIVVIAVMGLISGCQSMHIAEYGQFPTGTFMKATMLSGGIYPTAPNAKPVPTLFRVNGININDINVLPTNATGCFAMAEAVGNLSTERADYRLTTLSCLNNDGKTIIDESIKGFVVGADGKAGIPGHVLVHKIDAPPYVEANVEVKPGQTANLVMSESVKFQIKN